MIRPGPPRLEAGLAPDGVVMHVYDVEGRRLLERRMTPSMSPAEVRAAATEDADLAARAVGDDTSPFIVVVYDGDTGERHPDWMELESGSQL